MTKTELVQKVSDLTGVPEKATANVINIALESISMSLQHGESVVFPGFGTFYITHYEARTGRNIRTGEPLELSARNSPLFKASKALKDAVK